MNRILASLVCILAPAAALADGPPPPKAPPAEVTKMLDRMAGTWSATDVSVQMGPQTAKASSRVVCSKAPANALSCHLQVNLGKNRMEESSLFGWDPVAGQVRMFAVSPQYAHEHGGSVEGDVLTLTHDETRDGKPYHEQLSFTFKGKNEILWKNTCTLGGQVVFAGEGIYRK